MTKLDLPSFLPFRLNQLAAEISGRLSTIYAERFGLDIPQWRVLATLVDRDGATAQEIVESTRTHKSTISRAVQALTERGLVSADADGDDARSRRLILTAAGKAMMDKIVPLAKRFEQGLLRSLGGAESRQLVDSIAALEAVLWRADPSRRGGG